MTICIKTRGHCVCQPDEGVFCPDYKPDAYVQYLMDAITELRAQRPEVGPSWIATAERTPDKTGLYVGWHYGDDEPSIVWWEGQWCYGWSPYDPMLHSPSVTHWLPLPSSPMNVER